MFCFLNGGVKSQDKGEVVLMEEGVGEEEGREWVSYIRERMVRRWSKFCHFFSCDTNPAIEKCYPQHNLSVTSKHAYLC